MAVAVDPGYAAGQISESRAGQNEMILQSMLNAMEQPELNAKLGKMDTVREPRQ